MTSYFVYIIDICGTDTKHSDTTRLHLKQDTDIVYYSDVDPYNFGPPDPYPYQLCGSG